MTFTYPLASTKQLNLIQLKTLKTERIEVIPNPGENRFIVVKDLIISRDCDVTVDGRHNATISLILAPQAGGPLRSIPATDSLVYSEKLNHWIKEGQQRQHIIPGGVFDMSSGTYNLVADRGLVVAAIGSTNSWNNAVQDLIGKADLEFLIRYEIMDL